jgi:hypothetical protein
MVFSYDAGLSECPRMAIKSRSRVLPEWQQCPNSSHFEPLRALSRAE